LEVAQRTLPSSGETKKLSKKKGTRKRFFSLLSRQFEKKESFLTLDKSFYNFYNIGFSRFCEPLGLDLRNLDLTKERYRELRGLGFQTIGQILERLAFETNIFSPLLKKQRQIALFRFGLFPFLFKIMKDLLFFTKTVGRRKTAIANVKFIPGSGRIQVNGRMIEEFFNSCPDSTLLVEKPCTILPYTNFDIKSKVQGGGLRRQADSLQLALSRAFVSIDPKNQRACRKNHLLTRDSREKERRKYGLKKARKSPQFSKR
jgi:small subunit ribosomal protein S9